jgi:hypothetical protein
MAVSRERTAVLRLSSSTAVVPAGWLGGAVFVVALALFAWAIATITRAGSNVPLQAARQRSGGLRDRRRVPSVRGIGGRGAKVPDDENGNPLARGTECALKSDARLECAHVVR